MNKQKKVAFVCVHNSCRSQMAEAFAKKHGKGIIEVYSAGTQLRPQINQDAVRIMKELHQIDMEASQKSKLITDIPPVDYIITMGCNVECPTLPYSYETEDWGLADPSGKEDQEFIKTATIIEEKVLELIRRIR